MMDSMNITNRHSENVNYYFNITLLTKFILFSLDKSPEKLQEKIKATISQQAQSTTIMA